MKIIVLNLLTNQNECIIFVFIRFGVAGLGPSVKGLPEVCLLAGRQ